MIRFAVLFMILILCLYKVYAQNLDNPQPDDPIPLDPLVRTDTLSNGFTYYIRNNEAADGMVDIYFVVKAGSNQEEEDQIQLAHLLEHLAFVGSKHFPHPRDYFQKYGILQNAYVSSEHTCYFLKNISSANHELIQSGLQFMRDIARDLLLDSANIESERNVVWNELKMGQALFLHMKDNYMNQVIGNPGYKFIKSEDNFRNLKKFKHRSLLRFYEDWYHADNQGVVIVGDINTDSIQQNVRSLFGDLKRMKLPKQRIVYPAFQWKNQVITVVSPEQNDVEIQVIMKQPFRTRRSENDFEFFVQVELFTKMINSRVAKIEEDLLLPFRSIITQFDNRYNKNGPMFGAFSYALTVSSDKIEEEFKKRMIELERIKKYGFTIEEWESAKKDFVQNNLSIDKISSNYSIADQYIDHFVYGESYPGPTNEQTLLVQSLASTTLERVNQLASDLISNEERDIVILAPERLKSSLPDETTVMNWLEEVQSSPLQPYQTNLSEKGSVKELMTKEEESNLPANISYKQELDELIGVTKLTLSNGATVLLKPLSGNGIEKEKIYIQGISPGGVSLYQEDDRLSASQAPAIIMNSGLGSLSQEELIEFQKSKGVNVISYIMENEESIWGETQTESIESLLQMIYQYFKNPVKNEVAYKETMDRLMNIVTNKQIDSSRLWDSLRNAMGIDIGMKRLNPADISKIDLNKAYSIYKERFGDASDFTFVVTGNFELQEAIPVLVKYLGSLPSTWRIEFSNNTSVKIRNMKVQEKVYERKSYEPARIIFNFAGHYKESFQNDLLLSQLSSALQILLFKRLRDIEGGTYTVSVNVSKNNGGVYYFSISFECAVDNAESMVFYALDEIEKLKKNGLNELILQQIKSTEKNRLKDDLDSNRFWLDYLLSQIRNNADLASIRDRLSLIAQLTSGDFKRVAKKYLKKDSYFVLIVLPKRATSSSSVQKY